MASLSEVLFDTIEVRLHHDPTPRRYTRCRYRIEVGASATILTILEAERVAIYNWDSVLQLDLVPAIVQTVN